MEIYLCWSVDGVSTDSFPCVVGVGQVVPQLFWSHFLHGRCYWATPLSPLPKKAGYHNFSQHLSMYTTQSQVQCSTSLLLCVQPGNQDKLCTTIILNSSFCTLAQLFDETQEVPSSLICSQDLLPSIFQGHIPGYCIYSPERRNFPEYLALA